MLRYTISDALATEADLWAPQRKVRVSKRQVPASAASGDKKASGSSNARVGELISGLADVGEAAPSSSGRSPQQQPTLNDAFDLDDVYDLDKKFSMPLPPGTSDWKQALRPEPRRIELSHYQLEMINYQRMMLRKNIWYYRDRMNVARGPCPLHVLKEAWVQGVVDENTLMWGHGLADWLPAKNIKLLLPMIRTPEVRFGAWFKRTFSLKPALNRIREQRAEQRAGHEGQQVEMMR